jgi:UDP-N-acetylmuramate: L-alanyl-gamma-D-glutamyl-meso-diaminopimelate ligase
MHLHILGIGGTFMGGIALIACAAGHRVTGCDANVYPPMSDQLAASGIESINGWEADQVALRPDVYVIGNVVTRGNPLMEEILARGMPYISGPQWLRENALPGRWVLAVAGTHGKTTTASMLAWILEASGLGPGFLIGGIPGNFGVSARIGNVRGTRTGPFVVEADEYDTAFFDKRSKFLHYPARTTILNNLEFDHADIFPDLAAIETQFHHFVRTLPPNGLIVANGADEALARVLARGCYTPVERFGTADGWRAGEAATDGFSVYWKGEALGRVQWSLQGAHNRANALAAIAAARHCGVEPSRALAALGTFQGVKRRMEVRGTVNGVTVYDDFAHHPTAIATTIDGLRALAGDGRIVSVLEPRSNTMKAGIMKERLAASLSASDLVFCYSAGLAWDARAVLAPLGARAAVHEDFEQLVAAIVREARPGDHVLVMSNGGFNGIHGRLLELLAGTIVPAHRRPGTGD